MKTMKRLLAGLLALCVWLAVPLQAQAAASAGGWLSYDEQARVLSWTPVEEAASYTVSLLDGGPQVSQTTTAISIEPFMALYGEGSFWMTVAARDEQGSVLATDQILCEFAFHDRLPAPTGFEWSGDVLTWDAVEGADAYWVWVYLNDQDYETVARTNRFSVAEYLGRELLPGEVARVEVGSLDMTGARSWSVRADAGICGGGEQTIVVEFDQANQLLHWTDVAVAERYLLTALEDPGKTLTTDRPWVTLNELAYAWGSGAYTVEVSGRRSVFNEKGEVNGEEVVGIPGTSPLLTLQIDALPAVQNIRFEGATLRWDAVPEAERYDLVLESLTIRVEEQILAAQDPGYTLTDIPADYTLCTVTVRPLDEDRLFLPGPASTVTLRYEEPAPVPEWPDHSDDPDAIALCELLMHLPDRRYDGVMDAELLLHGQVLRFENCSDGDLSGLWLPPEAVIRIRPQMPENARIRMIELYGVSAEQDATQLYLPGYLEHGYLEFELGKLPMLLGDLEAREFSIEIHTETIPADLPRIDSVTLEEVWDGDIGDFVYTASPVYTETAGTSVPNGGLVCFWEFFDTVSGQWRIYREGGTTFNPTMHGQGDISLQGKLMRARVAGREGYAAGSAVSASFRVSGYDSSAAKEVGYFRVVAPQDVTVYTHYNNHSLTARGGRLLNLPLNTQLTLGLSVPANSGYRIADVVYTHRQNGVTVETRSMRQDYIDPNRYGAAALTQKPGEVEITVITEPVPLRLAALSAVTVTETAVGADTVYTARAQFVRGDEEPYAAVYSWQYYDDAAGRWVFLTTLSDESCTFSTGDLELYQTKLGLWLYGRQLRALVSGLNRYSTGTVYSEPILLPQAEGAVPTPTPEPTPEPTPMPTPTPDPATAPTIVVQQVTAAPGDTAEVTIALKNNPGLASMKLKVAFDEALTLTKVKYNSALGGTTQQPQKLTSPVTLNWVNSFENVEGDIVYATLTFTVAEDAPTGQTLPVTVTYEPDNIYDITETDIWFAVQDGGVTVQTHTPGDINGDGKVNNKDATRLFQYLSDWEVETVAAALDVNGDGKVNNKDATRLFQYLSDWDVEIF